MRPPHLLLVREAPPEPEEAMDWRLIHDRIVVLGAERATRERELCRWLRAAERLAVHTRVGMASLAEYAERMVGLRGRQVEERLRVARALQSLPVLDRAFARGELTWSAVRELTRVATADTESAWQRWAEGERVREVEQTVAVRHPGQRPENRPDPSLAKHRLRFEVRAETMALFRDLEARVRADLGNAPGAEVDDDMLLHEIARRALGGPVDDGRASYQVAVTRCPDCLRASAEAGGHGHELDAAAAEMVECDCQDVGDVDVGPGLVSPRVGTHHPCEAPGSGAGPTPSASEGERVSAAREESSPHAGAPARETLPPRQRATQTIPPATRRAVVRRDRGHCAVPGCSNHHWLDVHHVVPRAEGGDHDPERMLSLCGSHHAAVHRGALVIDGTASSGFSFRHADGTRYGGSLRPATVEATQEVLSTLEHLGFPSGRSRALVDAALAAGAPGDSAELLRMALRLA
jgi:hypothetical protein